MSRALRVQVFHLPVKDQLDYVYQVDPDTKVLLDCLSINAPLDEPTILQLPTPYRSAITRKFLGLLEGRLLCYKPIPTVTKNMCRIIVPTSLRHTTFNLMHSTPVAGHMGEYKILCRIRLRFVLASITFSCF